MEKKQASVWWVGFFLAATVLIVSSLLGLALMIVLGLISSFLPVIDWLIYTESGAYVMTVIGFVILAFATAYQSVFTRKRYSITDFGKAVQYATGIYVVILLLFMGYDWWTGHSPVWQDYVIDIIGIIIFYVVTKKYLHA